MRTGLFVGCAGLLSACGAFEPNGIGTGTETTTPFPTNGAASGAVSDAGSAANVDGAHPTSSQPTGDHTGERNVPIALVVSNRGPTFVTADVSVGGSPPFKAIVDTGSVGLRVLASVVPANAWALTTTPGHMTFGGAVNVEGVIASAPVTIGGVPTNTAIPVHAITSVSCVDGRPNCPAQGQDASTFRFAGSFAAILGIGTRAIASTGMASPFVAMGAHQRALISVPPFGGAQGSIIVDPTPSTLAGLTTLVALPSSGPSTTSGARAWDDRQVPFCMNAFCGNGLLDTGAPVGSLVASTSADYASLGVSDGASVIPGGTPVAATIAKTAFWSFTVQNPPQAGLDSFQLGGQINNLGLAPFHVFDVLVDYDVGMIGLQPKH